MKNEAARPRMSPEDIARSLRAFSKLRIVVVGDLFIDEYIESAMYEISKEGPIPVVRVESRVETAGASGNLASSIRNLGARVSLVAIVGKDPRGEVLLSQLGAKGIRTSGIIVDDSAPTLAYSKLRARVENTPSREILRMDVLPSAPLSARLEARIIECVRKESKSADAIIVLDQIHHLITEGCLEAFPRIAKSAKALLHGSSRDHIARFRRFDLITPNDREAQGAVGLDPAEPRRLGAALQRAGRHSKVLLTLGARGMALFDERGFAGTLPSFAEDVVDVTGAGDAVSAVAVLGNALEWDLPSVAWTASQAAAIAVAHIGTHHVSAEELEARLASR